MVEVSHLDGQWRLPVSSPWTGIGTTVNERRRKFQFLFPLSFFSSSLSIPLFGSWGWCSFLCLRSLIILPYQLSYYSRLWWSHISASCIMFLYGFLNTGPFTHLFSLCNLGSDEIPSFLLAEAGYYYYFFLVHPSLWFAWLLIKPFFFSFVRPSKCPCLSFVIF